MDNEFLRMYDSKIKLRLFLEKDHWFFIDKYLKYLRKEEFYFKKNGIFNRLISFYYARKKNSLGAKLGFYIPKFTIGSDVTIYHHGAITVSGDAKIGNGCILHGMNCIGNNGSEKQAPVIGNNVDIGVGAKIIGDVKIADNITIGANAVVTKSCTIEGATLVGGSGKSNGEKMKFSIIMPVYNTALYLKKSIQSVIEQTYENWELICVNDGSTDDSLEICEHYGKQDSRIKVFSKVNEGVSVARNFGLKKVTGERVIFLDADDWLALNALEVFSKYPLSVDFIIANYFEVFTNGFTEAKQINVSDISTKETKDGIIEFCVRESQWRNKDWYGNLRPVWGKCFSRELIEKSNVTFISGLKYGEDMVFLLSYLLECHSIAFTSESLYYYNRTNEGSAMAKRSWIGQEQGLLYFREVERLVKNRISEETLSDLWLETAESDWKVLLKSEKSFVAKYAIFKNLINTDLYRRFSEKTDYQEIGKKKKLFIFAIKHKQPMLLMLFVTLNNMRN